MADERRTSRNVGLLAAVIFLSASVCVAKEPKLYSLTGSADSASAGARVEFQRVSGGAALLLLSFDGKDPRSFSSMSEYAQLVRFDRIASAPFFSGA